MGATHDGFARCSLANAEGADGGVGRLAPEGEDRGLRPDKARSPLKRQTVAGQITNGSEGRVLRTPPLKRGARRTASGSEVARVVSHPRQSSLIPPKDGENASSSVTRSWGQEPVQGGRKHVHSPATGYQAHSSQKLINHFINDLAAYEQPSPALQFCHQAPSKSLVARLHCHGRASRPDQEIRVWARPLGEGWRSGPGTEHGERSACGASPVGRVERDGMISPNSWPLQGYAAGLP